MAQVSEVSQRDAVHFDPVDNVRAAFGPLLRIVESGDSVDERAFYLVLTGPRNDKRSIARSVRALNRRDVVVVGVVMADGDNVGGQARQPQPQRLVVGVGYQRARIALQPKARLAKPGNNHIEKSKIKMQKSKFWCPAPQDRNNFI